MDNNNNEVEEEEGGNEIYREYPDPSDTVPWQQPSNYPSFGHRGW